MDSPGLFYILANMKLIDKRRKKQLAIHDKLKYSPYCKICNSCGEEGCCPPTTCSNHPKGKYCEGNMGILKSSYWTLRDLYNELYKNEEKNKEIIDLINSLKDKNDEIFGVI